MRNTFWPNGINLPLMGGGVMSLSIGFLSVDLVLANLEWAEFKQLFKEHYISIFNTLALVRNWW